MITGSDINVPPPTLNNDNNLSPLGPNEQDDGQYREDPSIYYKDDKYNIAPAKSSHHRLANAPAPKPQQYHQQNYKTNFIPQQEPQYEQNYNVEPVQQYQPRASFQQSEPYHQPQPQYYQQPANLFRGHPAEHIDINTGSYSLTYTG